MTALEFKERILKPDYVGFFNVVVSVDDDWYHCHDNEELPESSLRRSQVGLKTTPSASGFKIQEIK